MSGKRYLKDCFPCIIIQLASMAGLSLFLFINHNSPDTILSILFAWLMILSASMLIFYQIRKKQLNKLLRMTEQLEERYLIAELMEKPARADDLVCYRILKLANRSMLEKIHRIECERTEYKDYIEQWVHEAKTPITAMKLLCENNHSAFTKEMLAELERMNHYTEQALYYARSEHTEKDYSVREIRLFDAVHQAIADNKQFLMQNNVRIELDETDCSVYSDEKWVCFILNQLLVNAVKYRAKQPVIRIFAEVKNQQTILSIQDNGIGIAECDLPRIFEKGFTGTNGRNTQNSTGIGLYLCKKLCGRLGIGLSVHSQGKGATAQLIFYTNHFITNTRSSYNFVRTE